MNQVATLPSAHDARLPENYENARRALAKCAQMDECQEWAKKAEAMASYARQANDDSLRKMADRIQARAIRRCGELLKQVEPNGGGRPPKTRDGADPSFSRTQAATEAGLSERQRKTALRVANVPEEEFEQAVESDYPPSVTALAEAGKKPGFKQATYAIGNLGRLAKFCKDNDPKLVASGLMPTEHQKARALVAKIDAWLDLFITNIGD